MVMRNRLTKSDGFNEYVSPRHRPRKFLFTVGDYDVAVKRKSSSLRNNHYIHAQIWHQRIKVGYIDLTTAFVDVKTILSVHTMINQRYQGLGIAYRVYEGLIKKANLAILTANQSAGAMKLWRKFASNIELKLYYVRDYASTRLFESPIHNIVLNTKEQLEIVDYTDQRADPYKRTGSLLLLRRNSPLDGTIVDYINHHKKLACVGDRFKPFDEFTV